MKRTTRYCLIAGLLLAACLAAAVPLALAAVKRYPPKPVRIAVHAEPIATFDTDHPARTRFGALEFRGGLVLTSKNPSFGGFSALHMAADGSRFLALSDRGAWFKGRIVYRGGRPSGIADAEMAPALAGDGKPLAKHGWYDTESLGLDDAGHAYVGIERVQRIVRFDLKKGVQARGHPIAVPADFKTLDNNKSLECLAVAPKSSPLAGQLIAVTEHSLDVRGNHRAFLLKGRQVDRFSVKRSDGFDVSDCAILPQGDLLLLERSYSLLAGVAMRIRRIPLAAIKPGALVDGTKLISANLAFQIDNMEGIGVSRDAGGDTILTLVSDDNFSVLQRTLLLQFRLAS
ncbi:MAG: esterase-like activity of phytase family protein [Pseudolabrys sp.]